MSTIIDVEKKSGVSRSTISRYLNGKPVTRENRLKIESAIKELDYKRNPLASGLKSNKTFVVGVVLPDITDPFFPPIVKQLELRLREHGYQTLINNYGNDSELEKNQVKILINQRVDGIIIASSNMDGSYIQESLDRDIPVVLLDRLPEKIQCDSVVVDNYRATFDAISVAIRKGHTKIGVIRGQGDVYTDIIRYKAFEDAMSHHGVPINDDYIVHASLTEHDAKHKFMRLVNMPNPPSIIFCSNVYLAAGALEARLEYSLEIPRDISVMTFDYLPAFPYYSFLQGIKPEFSSICQPLELIAKSAADLLLDRMKDGMEDYSPVHKEIETSFVMTESIKDIGKYI